MTTLGIIGCGNVAFSVYLPWLANNQDQATVAAVFDVQQANAERAAAMFPNATAYTSLDDLLAHPGLDAVFNLTPAPLHREINAAVLDAGLDLYTEKPLAGSLGEAQQLTTQAQANGRLLLSAPGISASYRFRWLKNLLAGGTIGRPTLITGQIIGMGPAAWRTYTGDPAVFYAAGVGPVVDTGVYLLHAVTGLLGPAQRVQAFGGIAIPERKVLIPDRYGETVTVESNDLMLLQLDFGNTTFAHLVSSYASPATHAPIMEIHATGGSISIGRQQWYEIGSPVELWMRDERLGAQESWEAAGATPPDHPTHDILTAGAAHFLACRAGEERAVLTPEHACHVIEIIEKAHQSVTEGRALSLTTTF